MGQINFVTGKTNGSLRVGQSQKASWRRQVLIQASKGRNGLKSWEEGEMRGH